MRTGSLTVRAVLRSAQEQMEIPLSAAVRALFLIGSHGELPFPIVHALVIIACIF